MNGFQTLTDTNMHISNPSTISLSKYHLLPLVTSSKQEYWKTTINRLFKVTNVQVNKLRVNNILVAGRKIVINLCNVQIYYILILGIRSVQKLATSTHFVWLMQVTEDRYNMLSYPATLHNVNRWNCKLQTKNWILRQ